MKKWFPHAIVGVFALWFLAALIPPRDKSVAALESAMAGDKTIFLVSQLDPAEDDPDAGALLERLGLRAA